MFAFLHKTLLCLEKICEAVTQSPSKHWELELLMDWAALNRESRYHRKTDATQEQQKVSAEDYTLLQLIIRRKV